jgi:hypothetical protein
LKAVGNKLQADPVGRRCGEELFRACSRSAHAIENGSRSDSRPDRSRSRAGTRMCRSASASSRHEAPCRTASSQASGCSLRPRPCRARGLR